MLKRNRILLLSSSIVMLCLCLIVGATYALFTESATGSTVHLQAGTLDATLHRHYAAYSKLNDDGTLETVTASATDTDFTLATPENFFGIGNNTLVMVPTSKAQAAFTLGNNGTTAFEYTITVASRTDTPNGNDNSLNADEKNVAKQISVIIYDCVENNGTYTKGTQKLGEGYLDQPIVIQSALDKGESITMWIEVVFVDKNDSSINNNDIRQNKESFYFDLHISATQKVQ